MKLDSTFMYAVDLEISSVIGVVMSVDVSSCKLLRSGRRAVE